MCTLGIKKQSAWDDSASLNCFFYTWTQHFCIIQLKTTADFCLYLSFFFFFFPTTQHYFYTRVFLEKSDWTTSCTKLLSCCVALGTDSCGFRPETETKRVHEKEQDNKQECTRLAPMVPRLARAAARLCTFSRTSKGRNSGRKGKIYC